MSANKHIVIVTEEILERLPMNPTSMKMTMKALTFLILVASSAAFAPRAQISRKGVAIAMNGITSKWSMDDPEPEVSRL